MFQYIERAPQVRPEDEVVRQVVFAAKNARQHEQAGSGRADAEKLRSGPTSP